MVIDYIAIDIGAVRSIDTVHPFLEGRSEASIEEKLDGRHSRVKLPVYEYELAHVIERLHEISQLHLQYVAICIMTV